MATMSPLRRRMIDDMMVRNLSPATQQSYIYAVRRFSEYFNKSPDRLGIEDVRTYQLHLIAQQRSWSHINQVSCALRFFFGVTLGRSEAIERIVAGREPQTLPAVLNGDEIVRFLEAVPGLRNRAALTTAYGAGLRVGEVARLKVTSIDSARMLIRIEPRQAAASPQVAPLASVSAPGPSCARISDRLDLAATGERPAVRQLRWDSLYACKVQV